MNIKKPASAPGRLPTSIAIGACVSIALVLIGILLASILIHSERISETGIDYAVTVNLAIASVVGSWVAACATEKFRLLVGVASSVVHCVLLLGITALFFDGAYGRVGETVFLITGCGIAGSLIGIYVKEKKKGTHRKKLNR